MTRETAIEIIKGMQTDNFNHEPEEIVEALDIAIKALRQEPKFIIRSDGTIEQIKTEGETIKPDVAQRLQNFLYRRLYESALNNVGYKCNAEVVFMDIADNRLKTWIHDFYDMERGKK